MANPSRITDFSTTTANNAPGGTEAIGSNADDLIRAIQSTIRGDLANKGADIASAATTDLGAVQGLMHDITGTTTITSFGTVGAGVWKIVKFEGALTLTHNATSLILPGAGNITTADGDVGVFISEGSGNWRCLSYQYATNGSAPVGSVIPFAGTTEPSGWLFCYGQAISRSTYARLFGVVSTTYGVGDGSTTFNLPDLRGRVVAGQDDMGGVSANRLTNQTGGLDGDTLGAAGGAETHTLTTAQIPSHDHTLRTKGGTAGTTVGAVDGSGFPLATDNITVTTALSVINSSGGGGAHNNVQPTFVLNYVIKF